MAGGKKAVLVGCNYPGTDFQLNGCVNDVVKMHDCLVNKYGFAEEDISVLIDTEESFIQPTGVNIYSALTNLVESAEPGDCLFFHYSGHGCRIPAQEDDDDDTGYDECIMPCDSNPITDDDFRELVHKVPEGCRITIVSDSCHSGGLIEQVKEQIGESTLERNEEEESVQAEEPLEEEHDNSDGDQRMKRKSLPLSKLVNILKQKSGRDDIDVNELRPTLLDQFGDDASPKVKKTMSKILSKLQGARSGKGDRFLSVVASLAEKLESQELENDGFNENEANADSTDSEEGFRNRGILVSGCQTHQFSMDLSPTDDPSDSHGALTNAILTVINEHGNVSNMELVLRVREMLEEQNITQKPGLYCSDDHAESPFICSMEV